jgi:hypothetical protein
MIIVLLLIVIGGAYEFSAKPAPVEVSKELPREGHGVKK